MGVEAGVATMSWLDMKLRVGFPAPCRGRVTMVVGSKVKLVDPTVAEAADMEARTEATSLMMRAISSGTVGIAAVDDEVAGVIAMLAIR